MQDPVSRKAAVSYSWKEEDNGQNAAAVDAFCEKLKNAEIEVVRDKDQLKPGECISEFMRDIGASDYLCVFLSDAYLKSPNCMYELLVAWQKSKDNPEKFRSRVKVWVMPGTEGIQDTETRLKYSTFWKGERTRRQELIEAHGVDGLAPDELKLWGRIKEFADQVNAILCFFADTLSPATVEDFDRWIREELGEAPPDEEQLAQVYEHTADEMEKIINGNARLRSFLDDSTPGLFRDADGGWRLVEEVRCRQFDACPHLKSIKEGLGGFTAATGTDLSDLEKIVGGVVVMTVDRQWILRQRSILRGGSVEYPALSSTMSLGEGQHANLLHIVSQALADGYARLHRLFGEPEDDQRQVPDPAQVMRGITGEDVNIGLKRHFVRYILGPDNERECTDPKTLNFLFAEANEVLRYAAEEEHNPYSAEGPAFRKLAKAIKGELRMHHLFLIYPSGVVGEEKILNDPIFVFKHTYAIFKAIEARRAQPGA